MSGWDDRKKFKYETFRFLSFAVLGFIATIVIVQPFENSAEKDSFLIKEKVRIKKEVIDDFLRTSYLYASSIYKVMSNDTGLDKEKEIELYELTYRNYRVDLNRMILYFEVEKSVKHYSLVIKGNELRFKLRQMYLNKTDRKGWKDVRLNFKSTNNEIAKLALRAIDL